MEKYEDLLAVAKRDYRAATRNLTALREPTSVDRDRSAIRAAEDEAQRLRAVVEALTVYTTGRGMDLQWSIEDEDAPL